jgi:D-erythro-7,8-dihydroneopterin triphosphate epimerase
MTDAGKGPSLDQILIRDLQFRCVVGIDPEERRDKQDITAQITLDVDLRRAGRTEEVLHMAESSQFHLIEALAESIASICLTRQHVVRVEVVVEKPGALRFARAVAVRIVRTRDNPHV